MPAHKEAERDENKTGVNISLYTVCKIKEYAQTPLKMLSELLVNIYYRPVERK